MIRLHRLLPFVLIGLIVGVISAADAAVGVGAGASEAGETLAWRAVASETRHIPDDAFPPARYQIGDLAPTLAARLPSWGAVASFAPRDTRAGAVDGLERAHADTTGLWLAGLGAVLAFRSPLVSLVGLRWARSVRGPPSAFFGA
jgi:hypothetical protein